MTAIHSLKSKELFNTVLNKGVKFRTTHLLIAMQEGKKFQIGFSVPKKLGNAVFRNKNKRRIKNIIPSLGLENNNINIVVIVKESFTKLSFQEMEAVVKRDLENAIKYLRNGKK